MNLLTYKNHKTIKGEKYGYRTYILYLSPYNKNSSGINICPFASKGCSAACLNMSGYGGMYKKIQDSRVNKTDFFLSNRVGFMKQLDIEISKAIKSCEGKFIPVFRLNGTSDIRFDKIKVRDNKNIFELYPNIQFYDYTKNHKIFETKLPSNYYVVFSRSEDNEEEAIRLLSKGINVSWVFYPKLPYNYMGYEVVNGDDSDLIFLNNRGIILGLKYKLNTNNNAGLTNKFAKDVGFVTII